MCMSLLCVKIASVPCYENFICFVSCLFVASLLSSLCGIGVSLILFVVDVFIIYLVCCCQCSMLTDMSQRVRTS